ncbi:MAG: zf-HC2 domain-containing protein [Planctomycetota bacterium]|jgi:anti-sigma factor RsiW
MKTESCRLSAFIDGELGPAERKQVEEHLASCPRCAEKYKDMKSQADLLARAGGGLLLHVDLANRVTDELPEERKSLVMTRTQGVRRRLALCGFGVAFALVMFSFLLPGPRHVLGRLSQPQQAVFFLNWAIMIAAGSLMVWPEKVAWLEARFWAFMRGGTPRVSARERVLVQGVGLVFLCLSVVLHIMLVATRWLPA